MTKEQIRSKILLKLKTQKKEDRTRKSKIIEERLFRTSVFKKAKKVMCYIAWGGEVDTKDLIKRAQSQGKIITVPACTKFRIMKPCILGKSAALKRGRYGLWEPAIRRFINAKDLDLVIVPGVAFDKEGHRLGRGKGYYDRFLKKLPKETVSVGLAFDFQILPHLPTTPHDVSVDKIISN